MESFNTAPPATAELRAELRYTRAFVSFQQGELEAARRSLEALLASDPAMRRARKLLGQVMQAEPDAAAR